MKGPDAYYTPPILANKLVDYIEHPVEKVVDFCAGEGNLLRAAESKLKNIECYGIDISEEVINDLEFKHRHWHLAIADFMNKTSLLGISWMHLNEFDLILMNPPYTCKGSTIYTVNFEGVEYHVSMAMLFILNAIPYLADKGCIYAIVPISMTRSQKDSKIWLYLEQNYNACILEECAHAQFGKCAPNVVFMYLSKKYPHSQAQKISLNSEFEGLPVSQCIRGTINASAIGSKYTPSSIYFIHTQNLQNGKIIHEKTVKGLPISIIKRYGVVIPRVCKPSIKKVALLDPSKKYILSDCVIAILAESAKDARIIRDSIVDNWDLFSKIYSGTGAQYTTMKTLNKIFGKHNI